MSQQVAERSQEMAAEGSTLVMKRTFAAPVEKVYQAWTDPAKMARWFSSNTRWLAPTIDVETVPGGRHNITMNHSDGDKFHLVGNYVEIVPNSRISFTWKCLEDSVDRENQLVSVEFKAVPDGTEMTLIHRQLIDPADMTSTTDGWEGCLAMLESYIQGNPPFTP